MTDIATISLKAETSDLERGTQKLKEFGSAAEKVSDSAQDLNKQFKRGVDTQKKATQAAEQQRKELHELLNQLNPTNKAFERLDEWQEKIVAASKKGMLPTDQFKDYNGILEQTRDKLQKMHMSLTLEGQALLAQEAATKRAEQAANDFLQSLKNQSDTLGKTRTEILELKAAQMGVSDKAAPIIAKLKEQEKAFMNGSITIGQYRNAMRQLPMQMTDIATSIASGMPLWLIMVQQGGQIKDSFGGIGNSLKAIGSFFTPARIAMLGTAGALTAVAVAAYKGSMEFSEYNKQLILTGGYAGKTASQLDKLSRQLSGNGITQYRMADALSKVVGSGAFSGNSIGIVAETSAKLEKIIGQDIDKTIEHFKRLRDDPVKAVTELNNSLHFLTAKQYEQIAAAEAQGRTEKAAELATKAYAEAMNQRSMSIVDNLGTLERAWNWIENAATKGWDAMLGVGRSPGAALQRQTAFTEWQEAEKEYKRLSKNLSYSKGYKGDNYIPKHDAERVENARKSLELKKQSYELADKAYAAEGLKAEQDRLARKAQEDAIKSQQEFNKLVEKGLSPAEKRIKVEEELSKLIQQNKQQARDGVATLWNQADIDKAKKGIQEQFKDKTIPKGKEYRPDYGTRADESANEALVSLQSQLKVLKEHKTAADVISAERKKLWDMEAKISILEEAKATRKLTNDEQALILKKDSILASQKALAIAGDEVELQKQKNRELDQQNKRIEEINARTQALIKSAGKSDRMYQRDIALEQAKSPDERKVLEDYYSKEDSLRANWEAGVKKGFAEFQDQATNVYGNVSQISQSFFQGVSNSLSDFVTTGKANLGDFTRSFLEMTTKMLMQMAMLNAMKAAFGGTAVGSVLGFAGGGYTGDGGKYEPKGVVHGGEFVFDKDSTTKLGVANLYRLMASGKKGYATGGQVGGSHPMTITQPKQRMYGMQPAGGIMVNVDLGGIHVKGGQQQQSSSPNIDAKAAEQSLTNKIKQVLIKEGRDGGDLDLIIKKAVRR